MSGITRPTEEWRRKARRALFGTEQLRRRVVLSPFAAVREEFTGADEDSGWWPVRHAKEVSVIQVPQGSVCVDAVLALEPGHQVTFIGTCGTLTAATPLPGRSLVEPERATAFDGTRGRRRWTTGPVVALGGHVRTVGHLGQSSAAHAELRRDADFVDMETAWVFAAALVARCDVRAVLAVTDGNQGGAVFETAYEDVAARLRAATAHANASW
ncbi:hypothetical protein Cs7R123_32420 [Catellatospora sp. TT07R-123]|uniref:hypothetical protein n=1 Tax=Catellatospora sp. TT07R-123 TaxID=2733863 RepID=UPI001AFE54D2|nr:hypothetical protein [Catellatospora sp. TT07R-123]GHJ45900.1 hypothetical protein Cs7R123_32420 [Catellatospora sp. TT07R-123]